MRSPGSRGAAWAFSSFTMRLSYLGLLCWPLVSFKKETIMSGSSWWLSPSHFLFGIFLHTFIKCPFLVSNEVDDMLDWQFGRLPAYPFFCPFSFWSRGWLFYVLFSSIRTKRATSPNFQCAWIPTSLTVLNGYFEDLICVWVWREH